jgi:vesicle coat complex subunit
VRAIGRCAVSLEKAAQRCISVLLELIQTKVNYVVQEAVIVIKVRSCCRTSATLYCASPRVL